MSNAPPQLPQKSRFQTHDDDFSSPFSLKDHVIITMVFLIPFASGKTLAEICREEYPLIPRLVVWLMTEIAIIGSDIQEVRPT